MKILSREEQLGRNAFYQSISNVDEIVCFCKDKQVFSMNSGTLNFSEVFDRQNLNVVILARVGSSYKIFIQTMKYDQYEETYDFDTVDAARTFCIGKYNEIEK